MGSFFSARGGTDRPWFRIGRLNATTTVVVGLVVVGSWLWWVLAPGSLATLIYAPELLLSGQIWRLFTWPLANPVSIWAILNLFFFWYFGSDLEQRLGRDRMARLLAGIWGSLTLAATLVGLLTAGQYLGGFSLIQFMVLLLWIAEYPTRKFFFNIPAWVLGAVLVGLQVLGMIAARDLLSVLTLLLSLALVAVVARRHGLLSDYSWIPGRPAARKPARTRSRPSRAEAAHASDRERMDALLDQISEHGLQSLSTAQRRELKKLGERLRRPDAGSGK